MADKGPIWEKIVEKNGLQKFRFEEIAAWGYPDGVFASDYDIVSDTSKARRFGFHDLVDTEEMFFRMDHIAVSLAPERQIFRRAYVRYASSSTRDQVVHLGEKHFEKRGRVRPVIADHQIDRRCFTLQRAADDRWRKKISRIKGQQGEATRGYDH
jgi:hypothetical protein